MDSYMNPPKKQLVIHSPRTLARLLNVPGAGQAYPEVPRIDANNTPPLAGGRQKADFPWFPSLPRDLPSNLPFPPLMNSKATTAPITHSVPSDIVPILNPKYVVDDFFTDLKTDWSNERFSRQIKGIVSKFPPPVAPFVPTYSDDPKGICDDPKSVDSDSEDDYYDDDRDSEQENEKGGIMIPFIYPPPPVINVDELPYSRAAFGIHPAPLSPIVPIDRNTPPSPSLQQAQAPPPPPTRGRKPKVKKQLPGPAESSLPDPQQQVQQQQSQLVYLQVPPLPFPPPNFMPYPLLAHKATITPSEAFAAMLDANNQLPRVDMVLASAAGSIIEIRNQAEDEGFEAEAFERGRSERERERKRERERERKRDKDKGLSKDGAGQDAFSHSRKRRMKSKPFYHEQEEEEEVEEEDGDEDDGEDEEFSEYLDYVQSMQRPEHYDIYEDDEQETNTYISEPRSRNFVRVRPNLSNVKHKRVKIEKDKIKDKFDSTGGEIPDGFLPVRLASVLASSKDVASANGSSKEKRRLDLKKSMGQLEEFQENNRFEVYKNRKLQLLYRLESLRKSTISFTNSRLLDDELVEFQQNLQIERDEELVRLKLKANYELLETSLIFYQESNRNYRHLNQLMVNKLEKLKNFFEYQRDLFTQYLSDEKGNVFDIGHKESSSLFQSMIDTNYAKEVRMIINESMRNDSNGKTVSAPPSSIPSSTRSSASPSPSPRSTSPMDAAPWLVATPSVSEEVTLKVQPIVHDFMPLISTEEFDLITGDLPSKAKSSLKDVKAKSSINLKHKIFKNPLYDRVTSGSDTNQSESAAGSTGPGRGAPKRRGRRAANSSNSSVPQSPAGSGTGSGYGYSVSSTLANSDKYKGISDASIDAKYTEATLLAKIMKSFNGPQSANANELVDDLDSMGLTSKWPVQK